MKETPTAERQKEIDTFLEAHGWADKPCVFLAGDCSNRMYYRLGTETTGHVLLMDAPPPERLDQFVHVAKLLSTLGLSVPEIVRVDLDKGLALIEDFGDTIYSKELAAGDHKTYYTLATQTLIFLHKMFHVEHNHGLPAFDLDLFFKELNVMIDWYYPEVYGQNLADNAKKTFFNLWDRLLTPLLKTDTIVLRDYMVDNLIYLKNRPGIQACGLLDFQDAVVGHRAYDLVSLLEDARYDVPSDIQAHMIDLYMAAFPELDRDAFLRDYAVLGAQRSIKILGIFMRMYVKHKKDNYLKHIPRVWRWIEQDLRHPYLKDLKEWMATHMPNPERKL